MKTIAKLFLLLIFAINVHSCADSQGHPQITFNNNEICLFNNGPNDNCENTDDQLIVIDYVNDGYLLSGYPFPYPVPLSADMEVSYMKVHEDPIIAINIDGPYIEFAFATSGSTAYNLNELSQIGLFMENGKTALMMRTSPSKEVTSHIFNENSCLSMSVYIDTQGNVRGERGNGVGTILVLSELQDSTLLPPMDGIQLGAKLALGDPFGTTSLHQYTHQAGIPLMYPAYVDLSMERSPHCNIGHILATQECTVSHFSQFARFFVSNNYLVVREPNLNNQASQLGLPTFFKIGTTDLDRVFIYQNPSNHEIVVWKYVQPQTF